MTRRTRLAVVLVAALFPTVTTMARGALVTNVSYQEYAYSADSSSGIPISARADLIGSTYPLHQTVTAQTPSLNGIVSTTYDFADGPSGTAATFAVSSRQQLSRANQYVSGGSTNGFPGPGTTFTLSAPAAYTVTCSVSATYPLQLVSPQVDLIDLSQPYSKSIVFMLHGGETAFGTLAAGDSYGLSDFYGLTSSGLSDANSVGTGQYTLTLTLTALPEPAAAGLATIAAAGVLAGRRHRRLPVPSGSAD